jgi:hypothetical protein
VSYDLYAWKAPRDLDADEAAALLAAWSGAGADPAASPFEPSSDVCWFCRELEKDAPGLILSTDAVPGTSRAPIWLQTESAPPARLVALRLPAGSGRAELDEVFGLATKYDLVVFDPQTRSLHRPLEALAAYAEATFWPRGAIQALVAGLGGGAVAVVAWMLGIPVVSGLVALAGGFMVVMAVYTFVHEGRRRLRGRRKPGA